MRDILKLGIVLMLYSLTAGALLAVVYLKTAPIIAANKEAAGNESLKVVLPGMEGGFTKMDAESEFPYWIGYADASKSAPGGYVFITTQQGYSSVLEIMVGVDTNGAITGVEVLSQQETPGVGDMVLQPAFKDQFLGKTAENKLAVTKDGGEIEAVSGATISSRAMTVAILNGLNRLNASLTGGTYEAVEVDLTEAPEDEGPVTLPDDETVIGVMAGMITTVNLVGGDTEFPYWIGYFGDDTSEPMGYAFIAAGQGFASTVRTLVGTDPDYTISGVQVLSQNETPGYGTRIVDEVKEGESNPWFMRQFIGKSRSADIALTADGGSIDALSGATITSKAVTTAISEGLATLPKVISGEVTPAKAEAAPAAGTAASTLDDETIISVMAGMITTVKQVGIDTGFPYWIGYFGDDTSEPMGYAFVAKGEGFASTIETLIGVDPDGVISGMKIVSQNETPGYGTRLVEEVKEGESGPWFPEQFIGKSSSDAIALKADGGVIDAMSGATVSSKAVTGSVADGLKTLMGIVSGEAAPPAKAEAAPAASAPAAMASVESPLDDDTVMAVMAGMITEIKYMDGGTEFPYWVGYFGDDNPMGYAFLAKGEGFASTIETLVGVDTDGVISGGEYHLPGRDTRIWFPSGGRSKGRRIRPMVPAAVRRENGVRHHSAHRRWRRDRRPERCDRVIEGRDHIGGGRTESIDGESEVTTA